MAKENLVERYRPRTLSEVAGNGKIRAELLKWAEDWKKIAPQWKGLVEKGKGDAKRKTKVRGFKPALVLAGSPGIGKTTCAHALAADMGWDVIELNASDARNRARIRDVVTRGAMNQVLSFDDDGGFRSYRDGKLTLIVLDEADNLYERKAGDDDQSSIVDFGDRGGKEEIIHAIQVTRQPIILIVNDWYALVGPRGGPLHECTRTLRFREPTKEQIAGVLRKISRAEGVKAGEVVLDIIATRSRGDVRGAINDLESVMIGRTEIFSADVTAVDRRRDRKNNIFNVMKAILLERDMRGAIRALRESDEELDMVTQWVSENLPLIYENQEELADGMGFLSRAVVFAGRIFRHQHYGYMRYMSELVSGGVCVAKKRRHRWKKMQFPSHIKVMSQSKGRRRVLRSLSRKVAAYLHVSLDYVKGDFLPLYRMMARSDNQFIFNTVYAMNLDRNETAMLLDRDYITALWKQYEHFRAKRLIDSLGVTRVKPHTVLKGSKDRDGSARGKADGKDERILREEPPEARPVTEEVSIPVMEPGVNPGQLRLDLGAPRSVELFRRTEEVEGEDAVSENKGGKDAVGEDREGRDKRAVSGGKEVGPIGEAEVRSEKEAGRKKKEEKKPKISLDSFF